MDEDHARLLNILQNHGDRFLECFGDLPNTKKRKRVEELAEDVERVESSEEEWDGIRWESAGSESGNESDPSDVNEVEDEAVGINAPDVIVFSGSSSRASDPAVQSKAQLRAFMSSKVSKVTQDIPSEKPSEDDVDEGEDERTNIQNDALLHQLVHTQLLTGSLNRDLNISRAEHRKALAGRVLELAGKAKLGKGEKLVREGERNKASKRVREGLVAKQQQREKQKFEETKDLGNYHPTLKKLLRSSSPPPPPKRERGLKMGVGKFKNGYLDLRKEAAMMRGESSNKGQGKHKLHNKKK